MEKGKYILKKYIPFDGIEEFYILNNQIDNEKYFIHSSEQVKYSLKMQENGYIPKSGLIFSDVLKEIVKGKEILDLCAGQLGFLGIHSIMYGAKKVVASDIDKNCVEWLDYIVKENEIKNIEVIKSNLFEKIDYDKFDIILSNPPQMPMLKGNVHDSGSIDGRKYILNILIDSIKHLKKSGSLYLLVFDFLGTLYETNDEKSLLQIAKKIGYSEVNIIQKKKKIIKPYNSVTYDNLEYIKNIYPKYQFKKIGENVYFYIQIIEFKK